jgi:hypothetical protein
MNRAQAILAPFTKADSVIGVEVGVFRGELSRDLLAAHKHLILLMVDSWKPFDAGEGSPLRDYWKGLSPDDCIGLMKQALQNTSNAPWRRILIPLSSTLAATMLKDNTFDFVYIDANHDYSMVLADVRAWAPKVKQGGILGGHDYYLREGVKRAVDELCKGVQVDKRNDSWFWRKI